MTERLYHRALPGGGYVAIDVMAVRRWLRRTRYHGTVLVERRSGGWRERTQHPLVVAEASGESAESVMRTLLPAAECNAAIGSALLRYAPFAVPASPIGACASHQRAPAGART